MSLSLSQLAAEALTLPAESRAYLAEKLLESLDFDGDFIVNEAWLKEAKQRCQDLDNNKVQTTSADVAISSLRKSLA